MQAIPCPYCSQPAPLVSGKAIYPHRRDLWSKKFYHCVPCGSWVGCHPPHIPGMAGGQGDGTVPLGRLANAELRAAKQAAHAAFDPMIWKHGPLKRREAYDWLAQHLGIRASECHIGQFDVDRCHATVAAALRFHNDEERTT